MKRYGLIAAALLASTAFANAAMLTGNLEIGGGSNIVNIVTSSPLTGNIGFVPGSVVLPALNGTSGDFLSVVGDAAVFHGQGSPPTQIDFGALTAASSQPFVTTGPITFTLSTATETLTTISPGVLAFDIAGTGTFNEAGFGATPGTFDYSTQSVGGVFQNTSFSASASAVPGPEVGAGLPGLAMLLGYGSYWWRSRKRNKSA